MSEENNTRPVINATLREDMIPGRFISKTKVPIDQLRDDGSIRVRLWFDDEHIERLAEVAQDFALEPIVVDQSMRIVDGLHRYKALLKVKAPSVVVARYEYRSNADAMKHAILLNTRHGKRLSNNELRQWVELVWRNRKDTKRLAFFCAVSERTIRNWTEGERATLNEELISQVVSQKKKGKTVKEIAAEAGVSKSTVARRCQKGKLSKMTGSRRKKKQARPKKPTSSSTVTNLPTDPVSCVKAACRNLRNHDIPPLDALPPGVDRPLLRAAWSTAKLMQVLNNLAGEKDGSSEWKLKKKEQKTLEALNGPLTEALNIAGVEIADDEALVESSPQQALSVVNE